MKRFVLLGLCVGFVLTARAQIVFSGGSLYSSNASGGESGGYVWEDVDGSFSNLYFFKGSTSSPVFLNSTATSGYFDANQSLAVGTHQIYFAANQVSGVAYVGLNLYFSNDFTATNNRITAVVPTDGTTSFSVVTGSSTTYGQNQLVAGSNSLSYTTGGFTVTLSALQILTGTYDLVGATSVGSNATNDTVGVFTLTVAAVPEPAAVTLWCGLAGAAFAVYRRRRAGGHASHFST